MESQNHMVVQVPEELAELAVLYLGKRRKELPAIHALLAAREFEQIRTLAHNLKGTGAAYGFERVTEVGASMERAAREQDGLAIEDCLAQLSRYLECVSIQA